MKIYTSDRRGNAKNVIYKYEKAIGSLGDLLKAVRCDHVAVRLKDNYRQKENFLDADCLMLDLDNTHSQSSDDWKTIDDISDTFPDVRFYYVHSRNSMKVKSKTNRSGETVYYEAREKYHIYFPLSKTFDQYEDYEGLMLKTAGLFPYFDLAAAKPAQPFFGVIEPNGGYIEGDVCIDEFMAGVSVDDIAQTVRDFSDKYHDETSDDTKKAIRRLFEYLRIGVPSETAPEPVLPSGPSWIDKAEQTRKLSWLKAWAKDHGVELGQQYDLPSSDKNHPDGIAICVSCPWDDDHSEEGSASESVIIIDITGKLNFLCRHSHGWKYGWKDYRAYYDQKYAVVQDPRNDQGTAAREAGNTEDLGLILNDNQKKPKSILPNYAAIIRHDFAGQIWLNALDNRITLTGVSWDVNTHPARDDDLHRIIAYIASEYDISSKDWCKMGMAMVAVENAYHPITKLLTSLKWDGVPRIADLFPKYLGADRTDYTTATTKLLLYGAIQRVMNPGIKFDYCVILADSIQGTGKSTMCRFLALNDDWFSDALDEMGDAKKAYESIRGHWIIELGEMIATRKTKDIEQIKAYISRQDDDYRDPYGVFAERRKRQCIFVGTTNKPQFLPDDKTGNRRFIPLICDGNKAEIHPREDEAETREYIRQCYAEAMQIGPAEGWPLVLDHKYDEELNAIREASTPDDPDLGILQEWLDQCGKRYVCSRLIYDEVFKGDQDRRPNRFELQNISDLMNLKVTGWHKYKSKSGKSAQMKFGSYGSQRAWERDDPVNSTVNRESTVDADDDFATPSEGETIPF